MQSKVHWDKSNKHGHWRIATYFDPPTIETRFEQLSEDGEVLQSIILPDRMTDKICAAIRQGEKSRRGFEADIRAAAANHRIGVLKSIRGL